MNCPLSVILPVYNSESYIAPCLDSILCQRYGDFELIIVNDASTDGSREIIQSYRDPRIRYIGNSRNQGPVRAMNRGLYESRGEYIARMDSDDICFPERFERQIAYLNEHKETDILGATVVPFSGEPPFPGEPPFSGRAPFSGEMAFSGKPPFSGEAPFPGDMVFSGKMPFSGGMAFSGETPDRLAAIADLTAAKKIAAETGSETSIMRADQHKIGLLQYNTLNNPTVMMRRSRLTASRLFYDKDALYAEDYKFWIDAVLCDIKIESFYYPLVYYRLHSGQLSYRNSAAQNAMFNYCRYGFALQFFSDIIQADPQLYFQFIDKKTPDGISLAQEGEQPESGEPIGSRELLQSHEPIKSGGPVRSDGPVRSHEPVRSRELLKPREPIRSREHLKPFGLIKFRELAGKLIERNAVLHAFQEEGFNQFVEECLAFQEGRGV